MRETLLFRDMEKLGNIPLGRPNTRRSLVFLFQNLLCLLEERMAVIFLFQVFWKQIGNKTTGLTLHFPADFIKNFQKNGFNVNKHSL